MEDNKFSTGNIVGFFILGSLLLGIFLGGGVMASFAEKERNKAIAANVARYEIDPITGNISFVFGVFINK